MSLIRVTYVGAPRKPKSYRNGPVITRSRSSCCPDRSAWRSLFEWATAKRTIIKGQHGLAKRDDGQWLFCFHQTRDRDW